MIDFELYSGSPSTEQFHETAVEHRLTGSQQIDEEIGGRWSACFKLTQQVLEQLGNERIRPRSVTTADVLLLGLSARRSSRLSSLHR